MVDPIKVIQKMIYSYYRLIDAAAPVTELKSFFDPVGFEIVEDELIIDSLEEYGRWYETVNRTLFNCKHSIEHIEIVKCGDGYSIATIQMRFTAKTAFQNGNTAESICVDAQIKWKLRHDSNTNRLYIVKYYISKKQLIIA